MAAEEVVEDMAEMEVEMEIEMEVMAVAERDLAQALAVAEEEAVRG